MRGLPLADFDPTIAFSPGDVMRRLRDVEQALREATAGRRLENASVGAGGIRLKSGGGMTVEDGGDVNINGGLLQVRAANGRAIMRIGPDEQGRPVFQLFSDEGVLIFRTFYLASGPLTWALHDLTGRLVLSADGETGVGLAEPWVPVVGSPKCFPSTFLDAAGTDATLPISAITSESTVWEGRIGKVSHPKIQVDWIGGRVTGVSGTPTYRFYAGGTLLGTWSHTAYQAQLHGPYDITDKIGDTNVSVQVRAQGTGTGTDRVAVQMLGVWMRQT